MYIESDNAQYNYIYIYIYTNHRIGVCGREGRGLVTLYYILTLTIASYNPQ